MHSWLRSDRPIEANVVDAFELLAELARSSSASSASSSKASTTFASMGRSLRSQECISRGDQSSGFKEFGGLAPGLIQLPDQGYRLYLESLFDEIGQEVGILFDRRDPSSLIWPRRQALNDLL